MMMGGMDSNKNKNRVGDYCLNFDVSVRLQNALREGGYWNDYIEEIKPEHITRLRGVGRKLHLEFIQIQNKIQLKKNPERIQSQGWVKAFENEEIIIIPASELFYPTKKGFFVFEKSVYGFFRVEQRLYSRGEILDVHGIILEGEKDS